MQASLQERSQKTNMATFLQTYAGYCWFRARSNSTRSSCQCGRHHEDIQECIQLDDWPCSVTATVRSTQVARSPQLYDLVHHNERQKQILPRYGMYEGIDDWMPTTIITLSSNSSCNFSTSTETTSDSATASSASTSCQSSNTASEEHSRTDEQQYPSRVVLCQRITAWFSRTEFAEHPEDWQPGSAVAAAELQAYQHLPSAPGPSTFLIVAEIPVSRTAMEGLHDAQCGVCKESRRFCACDTTRKPR